MVSKITLVFVHIDEDDTTERWIANIPKILKRIQAFNVKYLLSFLLETVNFVKINFNLYTQHKDEFGLMKPTTVLPVSK